MAVVNGNHCARPCCAHDRSGTRLAGRKMYMPSFPRSVRATLTIAIVWAIPWALGGAAFSLLLLRWRLGPFVLSTHDLFSLLGMTLLTWGIAGAAQGVLFALILRTIGRHWRR